ncbi:(2Fe-2S)-binding protein [Arthrobacter sp. UYEF3]|uniref:(2Fe-2S)-binding protein n=1 Tax=Arthrobacter sp. UYEF3 TaxID=1756365 RepID=UPI00339AD3F2
MNAHSSGANPSSTPGEVTVSFDGRPIRTAPGHSVASALVTNGITAWRDTRKHARPRGLFCGIGVCFDCLVAVDGVPNQRACLVEVRDGMDVKGSCEPPVAPLAEPEGGRK